MTLLTCTRFNNATWQEYQDWKVKHRPAYEQLYQRPLKCIYGTPKEISHKIPLDAQILVIEMNNDENKIMGIGEIQNRTASEVYRSPQPPGPATSGISISAPFTTTPPPPFRKIFSDRNYTRYLYIGNTYYATREELERNNTADAQYINKKLIQQIQPISIELTLLQSLERLLFKGSKHMKRGSGISSLLRKAP